MFFYLIIVFLLVVLLLYYYFYVKNSVYDNIEIPETNKKSLIEIFEINAQSYPKYKIINNTTFEDLYKKSKDLSIKLLLKHGPNMRVKINNDMTIENYYYLFIACMFANYIITNKNYDLLLSDIDEIDNFVIDDRHDTLIECSYNSNDIVVDNNCKMSNSSILKMINKSLNFIKENSECNFGIGETILTNRNSKELTNNLFNQIMLIFIPIVTIANVIVNDDIFSEIKHEPSIILFDDDLTNKLNKKLVNNEHSLNRFIGNKMKLNSFGFKKNKFIILNNTNNKSKRFLSKLHLNICDILCHNESGIISIDLNSNQNIKEKEEDYCYGDIISKVKIIDNEIHVKHNNKFVNTELKGYLLRNKLYKIS